MTNLMPWNPKHSGLRRGGEREGGYFPAPFADLDRMVETFFGQNPAVLEAMQTEFMPSIDISESEKEIIVTAELPGVAEKEIQVTLTDDTLTISGEKKIEIDESRGNSRRVERRYGSFTRSIILPTLVDKDKVEAAFENGVLKITLPKSPEYQNKIRSIPVQPGAKKTSEPGAEEKDARGNGTKAS